jgi:hypothetical protein
MIYHSWPVVFFPILDVISLHLSQQEELQTKKAFTTFDELNSIHVIDHEKIAEWRLRRCLVKWNLHTKIPGMAIRLIKVQGYLEDESFNCVLKLPPLVRKAITQKIWDALGPV